MATTEMPPTLMREPTGAVAPGSPDTHVEKVDAVAQGSPDTQVEKVDAPEKVDKPRPFHIGEGALELYAKKHNKTVEQLKADFEDAKKEAREEAHKNKAKPVSQMTKKELEKHFPYNKEAVDYILGERNKKASEYGKNKRKADSDLRKEAPKLRCRVEQLEAFIREKGLTVPETDAAEASDASQ